MRRSKPWCASRCCSAARCKRLLLGGVFGQAMRSERGMVGAYHGSPHTFEAFSSEKIGTGEGGQAYGHGLYFAESPGVARYYRDALVQRMGTGGPIFKSLGIA